MKVFKYKNKVNILINLQMYYLGKKFFFQEQQQNQKDFKAE